MAPSPENVTPVGRKPTESASDDSCPGRRSSTEISWKLPAGTPWFGCAVSRKTTACCASGAMAMALAPSTTSKDRDVVPVAVVCKSANVGAFTSSTRAVSVFGTVARYVGPSPASTLLMARVSASMTSTWSRAGFAT